MPDDPATKDRSHADVAYGRRVLEAEANAVRGVIALLDERFAEAVELILACTGRVVVTGIGKSGLIGEKISATLASTGTPSLFLHSAEAVHGDLGRVLAEDVVLALSYSGTTKEVVRLVPILKRIGASLISLTSTQQCELAEHADVTLEVGRVEEACPIGMAPTSSTTAMLALGDALAMTVAGRRDFNREEYARYHPGGALGRQLVTVGEVMRDTSAVPLVAPDTPLRDALAGSTAQRRFGALLVVDPDGMLLGIFTDGDLRRQLVANPAVLARPVSELMTRTPSVARRDELLAEAYRRLKRGQHDELPVVDDAGRAVGVLDVQDVLEFGIAL